MRILSAFKDYYDHQAHIYGGGDPKITYVRNRLKPREEYGLSLPITVDFKITNELFRDLNSVRGLSKNQIESKILVIAARAYLLLQDEATNEFCVIDRVRHKIQVEILTQRRLFSKTRKVEDYLAVESKDFLELSRLVGTPVFVINGYTWDWRNKVTKLSIDSEIPVLSQLGLPQIYKAEQLYQDLAYFIGNTMHESPDVKPPVDISDKDRMAQHGFDKQSFKHRV